MSARDRQFGEREGEKNAYFCDACRGYVVTVNRAAGVTPMFLACRVLGAPGSPANDCDGRMHSLMYPKEPWPETDGYGNRIPTEPTHEWYRPEERELRKMQRKARRGSHLYMGLIEHARKGGLLLREIRR